MINNCTSPLKLNWKESEWQYKVNKPLDQSGEYVDKKVADAMLHALIDIRDRCMANDPVFNLPKLNDAIELATTSVVEVI